MSGGHQNQLRLDSNSGGSNSDFSNTEKWRTKVSVVLSMHRVSIIKVIISSIPRFCSFKMLLHN